MHNLEVLASALRAAKSKENLAKDIRISIEEDIAKCVETKEVGQKTVTLENGTKVTVKRGLNYRADIDGIYSALEDNPFHPPVKMETKYSLDVKGYEWYRENNSEIFERIAKHVTVTPKKIAVTLQEPKK